jgi:RHS repeat-associated protein
MPAGTIIFQSGHRQLFQNRPSSISISIPIFSSTFDELNRVKSIENSAVQRKLTYAYTANGQRASSRVINELTGEQNTTSYAWNSMGRLEQIQPQDNDAITYSYNLDGSRNSVTLPNNLRLSYSHDSLGRLTGMEYRDGNSGLINFFNYELDASGNRTTMVDSEGETQYTYDNLSRLVEADYPDGTFERFTMDIAGRRIQHEENLGVTNYHYNLGDSLLSTTGAKPSTSSFDNNGNTITKETPDGLTSYFYSARDRLEEVTLENGTSNRYTYLPESDLRLEVTDVNNVSKRFFYEGQNVIEEMDAFNGTTARFIEGLGVDEHIARIENGNVYAYVTDPLGTVRNVVDGSGTVLNSYDYKAYGDTRNKTEAVDNDYLFTGRSLDSDTGDYYYRARYYNSEFGQFGATDRYAPDEATYGYAGGNPVMMVDPWGTTTYVDEQSVVYFVDFDGQTDIVRGHRGPRSIPFGPSDQGSKLGNSRYVDSFTAEKNGVKRPWGRLKYGRHGQEYMNDLLDKLKQWDNVQPKDKGDFLITWYGSLPNKFLDIKTDRDLSNDAYDAYLVDGCFTTGRELGNWLAGWNAARTGLDYETFQLGAGIVHLSPYLWNCAEEPSAEEIFKAPRFGECKYQYNNSKDGFDAYKKAFGN